MTKQRYRSVYFSDHPGDSARERSVTLAFGKNEEHLYRMVRALSSEEVRQLIGNDSYSELVKSADDNALSLNRYCISRLSNAVREIRQQDYQLPLPGTSVQEPNFDPISVTFRSGKKEPFSRWYPFIEGYSPRFVAEIIRRYAPRARVLLDPFAGTGSSVVAASEMGIRSFYCELNPVLQFTSRIRLRARSLPERAKRRLSVQLMEIRNSIGDILDFDEDSDLALAYQRTFGESCFFSEDAFSQVLRVRSWIDSINDRSPFLSDLLTVATLASLVPSSRMKRAGDLRYRRDSELSDGIPDPVDLIEDNIGMISEDLSKEFPVFGIEPLLISEDALSLAELPNLAIDVVVTSPPYVNGTNYFRNTKIELWFLRAIREKRDLTRFRSMAITSGINDVHASDTPEMMRSWVGAVVSQLEKESYDPRIPKMVASYFDDMERAFTGIRRHLLDKAVLAVDLGDSAYAGVHVPSHSLLDRTLEALGFDKLDQVVLRTRRSRGGMPLGQYLLVYEYRQKGQRRAKKRVADGWPKEWRRFRTELPHQSKPYSKRNWGHTRHSLCSYQGKLKPSIAHHLVEIFVPEGGKVLDPFAGVGTIPFEAALQGKTSFGFEISPAAYYIARGKCSDPRPERCASIIRDISETIGSGEIQADKCKYEGFGLNGKLREYYEGRTFQEILTARKYFLSKPEIDREEAFVLASLLHILHGNRPYAISRRSHPITPYKPSGGYCYKSVIKSLKEKVDRMLSEPLPMQFVQGEIWLQDATSWWPDDVDRLDAVITSPPFFDSTRFYAANWIRLWFAGWDPIDFETKPLRFIDNRQKEGFDIYQPIFRQARERMKKNGVLVMHLGKSKKCNMARELEKIARPWFRKFDLLDESVLHIESHGIRDQGSVSSHQYLVMV